MRRALLLILPLLFIPPLPADAAGAVQNVLPDPTSFVPAGPHCKRRFDVSPSVGTPGVNWPKTYQCVLTYHTCSGVKTVKSSERPGGAGMCDDYWAVHDALANRVICCDRGEREEEKPTPTGANAEDGT